MKNKGFTLMELLAVIVILAIIALIATPIILNIISNSKEASDKRSVEIYSNAANIAVARYQMKDNEIQDGTYEIESDGNICLKYEDDDKTKECIDKLIIETDGDKPTGSKATIVEGIIVQMKLILNGKKYVIGTYAGLYDKDGNILVTWDELAAQGMDVQKNYTGNASKVNEDVYPGGIVNKYEEGVMLIIDDDVTTIGSFAFAFCNNLITVIIPDSVTIIGNSAFYGCGSLTNITIPDSVTTIGKFAFNGCDNLTSMTIPNGMTSIGDFAFYNSNITSITIPDSVTTIGNYAFSGCDSLTSITIPDSVTTIGESAFAGCDSLTSITIPDSVTTIGESAFSNCDSLTSITIPNSVTTIGNYAFSNCNNLTSVNLSEGLKTIGSNAFQECNSLTRITIPSSVTTINTLAFYNCKRLSKVYFNHTDPTSLELANNPFCYGASKTFYFKNKEMSESYPALEGKKVVLNN